MIEKLTKRRVRVETILWNGTDERAAEIKAWAGRRTIVVDAATLLAGDYQDDPAFVLPAEITWGGEHALLWVAHNRDWCSLPIGYRVARELDGSGFYPLSPEGAAAGYEMPGEVEGSTLTVPERADEPAPVPPPVDALLKLIGVYGQARFAVGAAEERDSEGQATKWRGRASEAHETITNEVNALWAAGVAEGRRLAEDEFDNRSTYELAGLVHRYLHVEAPDNSDPVQVAIEVLEEAIQDHDTAGALETRGVAEGRRQATEERGCACGHPWKWHARGRCAGDLLSCSCALSLPAVDHG